MTDDRRHAGWFLEGTLPGLTLVARSPIHALPFTIGRSPESALRLDVSAISWTHAVITADADGLRLVDLDSTNGTWINGERLRGDAPIRAGDLIQLASLEFRVGQLEDALRSRTLATENPVSGLHGGDSRSPRLLRALLREEAVEVVYQPIVECATRRTVGFEALGRAHYEGLPATAGGLLKLAEPLGLQQELSRLFRRQAIVSAAELPSGMLLFLNTHPSELAPEQLIPELGGLQARLPNCRLVLEIHEAAVTDVRSMGILGEQLAEVGVALAYDDFGAGQARLLELADAPPQFLKFDRSLIHRLDEAGPRRQQVVAGLVRLAKDAGVTTLAECVETASEAATCLALGFDLGQGFYYARPRKSG